MKLFSRRRNLALPYAIFLGIMVVVPMLLIIIYAFMGKDGGFSLENSQPPIVATSSASAVSD